MIFFNCTNFAIRYFGMNIISLVGYFFSKTILRELLLKIFSVLVVLPTEYCYGLINQLLYKEYLILWVPKGAKCGSERCEL